MSVIQLTKENFQEKVLDNANVTLVDFYADWCGPCKMMAPVVAEIAEENPQFTVGKSIQMSSVHSLKNILYSQYLHS